MSTGGRLHTLRPSQRAPHTRTGWGWRHMSHSADEKKIFFALENKELNINSLELIEDIWDIKNVIDQDKRDLEVLKNEY